MIHYQILYWRDIPAQVKIYTKRRPTSHALSSRFQIAIESNPSEIAARIVEQVEREGDKQLAAYRKRS